MTASAGVSQEKIGFWWKVDKDRWGNSKKLFLVADINQETIYAYTASFCIWADTQDTIVSVH